MKEDKTKNNAKNSHYGERREHKKRRFIEVKERSKVGGGKIGAFDKSSG